MTRRLPRRDGRLICLVAMSLLFPTACSGAMNSQPSPSFVPNPEPRQAYTLTVRIQGAPGPLEVVASAAQYDVRNTECLPPPKDNPEGRTAPVPTQDLPITLQRISDNEYRGTFYADGMLDQELHGRGVCHWALIQAQVQLKATGAPGETRFIAKIGGDELGQAPSKTKAFHYWKARYPKDAGYDDYPDYGQGDLRQLPADKRDDFFEVSLTAKEA
ncbi:hypothetical protein FB548_0765 [Pseudoxanthomonas sp. 3HH-4]|nr:hypothetical protein FB548_0765 [Pseudoxanthomonas sp. 3HH-4]